MKIAITGGIGSGKSYVCQLLKQRGIQVYDCDAAAKRLMRTSPQLQQDLKRLVGDAVYSAEGELQKSVLAEFILAGEANKLAVNDVVHPAVAADFDASGMEWLESAILFESRFDRRVCFDKVVCVVAPQDVRIQRIMKRDNISAERAAGWIAAQMPQEEMQRRSTFVINNDGVGDLGKQIDQVLAKCRQ
ncbi:dephospho-CoA kinase [uncultured Prevotella sp.]|uniref:dephospho-CoA kinase n=1 Tax=uncultured Prevotella sp. TaxID=159272 RepID=UPI00260D308B|nr:dephospho-CoA kinase [uncultured Prevotella sp.]